VQHLAQDVVGDIAGPVGSGAAGGTTAGNPFTAVTADCTLGAHALAFSLGMTGRSPRPIEVVFTVAVAGSES
jgi:hypothetical protein